MPLLIKVHPSQPTTFTHKTDFVGRTISIPTEMLKFQNGVREPFYTSGITGGLRCVCEKYYWLGYDLAIEVPKVTNDTGMIRNASNFTLAMSYTQNATFGKKIDESFPVESLRELLINRFNAEGLNYDDLKRATYVLKKQDRYDLQQFINFVYGRQ